MSSFGLLIVILAIWIILNADKIALVMMGKLKLNHAHPPTKQQ